MPVKRRSSRVRYEQLESRIAMAVATLSTTTLFQTVEGFGTHLNADSSLEDPALLAAYRDAGFSMVRLEVGPGLYTANRSRDLTIPVPIDADYAANIARFDFESGGWAYLDDAVRWLKNNAFEPDRFRLTGSVWSPPHWLKVPTGTVINWTNWDGTARSDYGPFLPYGKTGGNSGGGRVAPENYQAMARWVLSFVKGYSEFVGIPIDSFSFQNEPDYEGFYSTTSYGRRAVDPSDPAKGYVTDWTIYADAFQAIVTELAAHPEITTRMIGPEIMTVAAWANGNSDKVRQALVDRGLLSHMDIIGAHGYESVADSASGWSTFWNRYADTGKPIYQTETSGERQIWRDATDATGKVTEGGLALAVKISNALVHGRVSGYEYWSFSNSTEGSSLVQPSNRAFPTVDPKYAAMVQFSRFIRPGARRIGATFENGATAIGGANALDSRNSLNVSAYYHPTDKQVTAVLVNRRATTETTTITLPSRLEVPSLAVYRTSETERVASLQPLIPVRGMVTIDVPPHSVVTIVGRNVSTENWTVGVPDGWSAVDVGSPAVAGAADSVAGRWTIRGAGSDIWGQADQFQFASRDVWGDASVTARVESVQNTNSWAKAGVMMRESTEAGSAFVAVYQLPNNEVTLQWRAANGAMATFSGARVGGTASAKYVRLTRAADIFRGFYSIDGVAWTEIGGGVTIAMPEALRMGLAVTSRSVTTSCTAVFMGVSVAVANAAPVAVAGPSASLDSAARSAALAVTFADDQPATALAYTWLMVSGPAAVKFSENASNVAMRTTASFVTAGTYILSVTARDPGGLSTTRLAEVVVPQIATSLDINPAVRIVESGSPRTFSAVAGDQFGAMLASQPPWTWSVVAGVGAIDSFGTFMAPMGGRASIRVDGGGMAASVVVAVAAPTALAATLPAETALFAGGCVAAASNKGYRGAGYADFPGSGGVADFTAIDGGSGGETVIWLRYALGAAAARAGRLTVNGVASTITFQPTGAWSTWAMLAVPVSLAPGRANSIRIESIGQDLANIDEIQIADLSSFSAIVETVTTPEGMTRVDATSRRGPLVLRKEGGGTLVLTGGGGRIGATVVAGGELVIRSAEEIGSGLEILAGARVRIDAPGDVSLPALELQDGAWLQIADGVLSVPAGNHLAAEVRSLIVAGRDDVSGRRGITASASSPPGLTVGWRFDSTYLHLAPAIAGDSNLDGLVDIIDIAEIISAGVYDASVGATWAAGDTNHDGLVDILDIAEILQTGVFNAGPYRGLTTGVAAVPDSQLSSLEAIFAAMASEVPLRRKTRRPAAPPHNTATDTRTTLDGSGTA